MQGLLSVTVASLAANGLGYLLTLVGARWLGPDQFSAFAALMAALVVGNVVALGVQATTARTVARAVGTGSPDPPDLAAVPLVGSLALLTAGLLLAWPLSQYLHLGDPWAVLAVAGALVPITWISYIQGQAQGRQAYRSLSGLLVLGATGKVLGALAGMLVGGATAAMVGLAIGSTATAFIGSVLTRCRPGVGSRHRKHSAELAHATHALFAFFMLANVDVLLARHYLEPRAAGTYALGAIISKVAFWLPQSVGLVAFPRLVDPNQRGRTIRVGGGLVLAVGACTVAGAWILGARLAAALGGEAYGSLAGSAATFAAIGASLALAHLLLLDRIAHEDWFVIVVVWTAVLSLVLTVTLLTHQSVASIAATTLAAAVSLALVSLLVASPMGGTRA